jgi:hypothetical protein
MYFKHVRTLGLFSDWECDRGCCSRSVTILSKRGMEEAMLTNIVTEIMILIDFSELVFT